MKTEYRILIDSTALGRRYVARDYSKARQHYTKEPERAMVLWDYAQAKEFAKTWAARTGCDFLVHDGEGVMLRAEGKKERRQ